MGADESIRIRVELFARAREAALVREVTLELPVGARVAAVRPALSEKIPRLAPILAVARLAVNETYAEEDATLSEGDRVAVIPPVSGGLGDADFFAEVTEAPLDITPISVRVARPEAGALVLFLGLVRNETKGEPVTALTYEAHVPMAEKEMLRILQAARMRHGLVSGGIVHRIGRLAPPTTSVVIATVAPHREAAYAANREILEDIKRLVPIWKKEERPGGSVWVEGGG